MPIELNIPLGRLSPQSVRNAITTTDLGPPALRAIIDALVETSNSRHQQYLRQARAEAMEHKTAIEKLEESLEFAESRLLDYQETFVKAPDGYVANDRLPTFTIPLGEGSDVPAKCVIDLTNKGSSSDDEEL